MPNRESLLRGLAVGDIFHAEYPNGASCICLVTSVGETTICARRVTTQENLAFNRRAGLEETAADQPQAVIDSVEPLPSEVHKVFLEMNKNMKH